MNVHPTYYDDHCTMYVSQIIVLDTFNSYSAGCQLYLNKTGRKKRIVTNLNLKNNKFNIKKVCIHLGLPWRSIG